MSVYGGAMFGLYAPLPWHLMSDGVVLLASGSLCVSSRIKHTTIVACFHKLEGLL